MSVDPNTLIAVLGGGGVAGIMGAIVQAISTKRKLGADATEIITKAASGVVERVEADNTRLREEIRLLRDEIHEVTRERNADREEWGRIVAEHTRVLQLHAAWDALAASRLRQAGITDLPDPPAMYPEQSSPRAVRGILDLDA